MKKKLNLIMWTIPLLLLFAFVRARLSLAAIHTNSRWRKLDSLFAVLERKVSTKHSSYELHAIKRSKRIIKQTAFTRAYSAIVLMLIIATYAISVAGRAHIQWWPIELSAKQAMPESSPPDNPLLPTSDDAKALATVFMGIATGYAFLYGQKRAIEDKHRENLKVYIKRYTESISELMLNDQYRFILNADYLPVGFEAKPSLSKIAIATIGLFSEEYELLKNGSIDEATWLKWKNGMEIIFSQNPAFWQEILREMSEFYDYTFLTILINDTANKVSMISAVSDLKSSLMELIDKIREENLKGVEGSRFFSKKDLEDRRKILEKSLEFSQIHAENAHDLGNSFSRLYQGLLSNAGEADFYRILAVLKKIKPKQNWRDQSYSVEFEFDSTIR